MQRNWLRCRASGGIFAPTMNETHWAQLRGQIEHDDLKRRIWLASWFVGSLSRRPDILEQLWLGSVDADEVGWRWCEYRFSERTSFPRVFDALYGDYLDVMPTAPVFILRAPCDHCGLPGFFVSENINKADREARGVPRGRCAECRRSAARTRARQ